MKKIIKFVTLALTILLTLLAANHLHSLANQSGRYIDKSYLINVPFGTTSHWLQPWRAYLETIPATKFLDGIGVVFQSNNNQNSELIAQMLAEHGVRHARFEIGWGALRYDENKLKDIKEAEFRNKLIALKKFGIRPLILLNSNHGLPCPTKFLRKKIIKTAHIGDRHLTLDSVNELRVGYSGLSNLFGKKWAAESLITEIAENQITLSKPLTEDITAGSYVEIATLKYRPFSSPNTKEYQETLAGWLHYVSTVTKFVTESLETVDRDNRGFDLEIWNELTFGSNFLDINQYYESKPYKYEKKDIWKNIIDETAKYISNNPADFQGVRITNGFANTIPWPSSSQLPARIHALSKHPYPKLKQYPQDEPKSQSVNALGVEDHKFVFTPRYKIFFPESSATAISSTLVRDMAPITSKIKSVDHGRYGRKVAGQVIPTPMWITEANVGPSKYDPNISSKRALKIKAKAAARYFCFFLNKGAERLYLFAAGGKWKNEDLAVVQENFLEYGVSNSNYPNVDNSYVSPALEVLKRICDQMSQDIDFDLVETEQLEVVSITDLHNHYQFRGDNTEAHPNLYDRDVFTFLPFQVNKGKFVIPYYVMTRNIMKNMIPEKFTVKIASQKLNKASVDVYDPLNNRKIPVLIKQVSNDNLTLELTATDYPYLLIIDNDKKEI
jgi:hypothetical protein